MRSVLNFVSGRRLPFAAAFTGGASSSSGMENAPPGVVAVDDEIQPLDRLRVLASSKHKSQRLAACREIVDILHTVGVESGASAIFEVAEKNEKSAFR